MTLSEIVAVTNLPGLYKVAARRNDGLIATSLIDGKTQFIPGRTHMFTQLDNITMYTTGEPVALKEVFASIKKNEAKTAVPDGKDDAALKQWLEVVLPNYDKEKVYASDIKKLAKWYTLLNNKNLIEELIADKPEGAQEEKSAETTEVKKESKPKTEKKPKVQKDTSAKASTKPAPAAKKITTPRKAQ